MFFCEPCQVRNSWPNSIFKSYGRCKMCDKVTECNDVPSKYLPPAKPQPAKIDIDSIT